MRDDIAVEFIATMRNNGKMYSLTVVCEEALTAEEFANCLVTFAEDISDGTFSFDKGDDLS